MSENNTLRYVKPQKRSKKLFREDETISAAEIKRLQKKIRFTFLYERQNFNRDLVRDFRLKLETIIKKKYDGERVKKIPEEFELEIKVGKTGRLNQKYLIVLANKEELLQVDPKIKFDPKNFEWMKGIDEQEYGYIDDGY